MLIELFTMAASKSGPRCRAVRSAETHRLCWNCGRPTHKGRACTTCWLTGMRNTRVLLMQRLGHAQRKARRDVIQFILKNKHTHITNVGLCWPMQFKAPSAVAGLWKFVPLEKSCCLEGFFICSGQIDVSPA